MIVTSALFLIGSSQPCFSCSGAVKTITVISGTLYGGLTASVSESGTAYFSLSLNNPGLETYITSLSIWQVTTQTMGNANSTTISSFSGSAFVVSTWQSTSNSSDVINFSAPTPENILASDGPSTFSFYPRTASQMSIATGESWSYTINFANGQSIGGFVIVQ